jgi:hypothetical protein
MRYDQFVAAALATHDQRLLGAAALSADHIAR